MTLSFRPVRPRGALPRPVDDPNIEQNLQELLRRANDLSDQGTGDVAAVLAPNFSWAVHGSDATKYALTVTWWPNGLVEAVRLTADYKIGGVAQTQIVDDDSDGPPYEFARQWTGEETDITITLTPYGAGETPGDATIPDIEDRVVSIQTTPAQLALDSTLPFGVVEARVSISGQVTFTFSGNSHAESFAYKVSESGFSGSVTGATVVDDQSGSVAVPTGTIQLTDGQTCYIEGWFYGSANGTGLIGPRVTASITQVNTIYPTVAETASESGTTGTLALTITDPQGRLVDVAFKVKSGDAAWPGSWTTDTAPYSANVTLVEDHTSAIAYRVRFTDESGNTKSIENVVLFDIDAVATVSTPVVTFADDDEVLISASGDSDTANIYVTAQVGSAPADPTSGANNGSFAGRNTTTPISTGVTCRRNETVYVKARGYNSSAVAGPVRSVAVTHPFWYTPTVEETVTESAGVGTLALAINDPLSRVTKVEFNTKSGSAAESGWVEDTAAPYSTTVSLHEDHPSKIAYRITFTDENNASRELVQVVTFDTNTTATVTNLAATFDSSDNTVISASGDSDAANIYVTAQVGSAPADPTSSVNNGTIAARSGTVSTSVVCRRGQTVYVKARAYNSAGSAGPVMSARFVHGFWYTPSVEEETSESAGVGTLALTVTDPLSRVTEVAFNTQSGPAAFSGWVADTAPYSANVNLHEDHISKIAYRIRFTDETNATREIIHVVAFDADSDATVGTPGISFGTDGAVTVSAMGDSDTANIYFTITTDGSEPADPTSGAHDAHVAGRTGSDTPAIVADLGDRVRVKARGYNSTPAAGPVAEAEATRDQGAHTPPAASISQRAETPTQTTLRFEGSLGSGSAPMEYRRKTLQYNTSTNLGSGWGPGAGDGWASLGSFVDETFTRPTNKPYVIALQVRDAEGTTSGIATHPIAAAIAALDYDTGEVDPDVDYKDLPNITPRVSWLEGVVGRRGVGLQPVGVILNGGGQTDDDGDTATSWTLGGGNALTVSTTASKFGDRSLSITNAALADSFSYQSHDVEAGDIVEMVGWIKVTGTSGAGAGAVLHLFAASGATVELIDSFGPVVASTSTSIAMGPGTGVHDFTYVRGKVRALTAGTLRLYCQLGYGGTIQGTAYYDGVDLIPLPPETDNKVYDTIAGPGALHDGTGIEGSGGTVRVINKGYAIVTGRHGDSGSFETGLFSTAPVAVGRGGVHWQPEALWGTNGDTFGTTAFDDTLAVYVQRELIVDGNNWEIRARLMQKDSAVSEFSEDVSGGFDLTAEGHDVEVRTNTATFGDDAPAYDDKYYARYKVELNIVYDPLKAIGASSCKVALDTCPDITAGSPAWVERAARTYSITVDELDGDETRTWLSEELSAVVPSLNSSSGLRLRLYDVVQGANASLSVSVTPRDAYTKDFVFFTQSGTNNYASMTPDAEDEVIFECYEAN